MYRKLIFCVFEMKVDVWSFSSGSLWTTVLFVKPKRALHTCHNSCWLAAVSAYKYMAYICSAPSTQNMFPFPL